MIRWKQFLAPPLPAVCLLAFLLAGMLEAALAEELPTFHVVARAGRFTPPRIEVPAGQRVKLTLQNDGVGPLEFENLDLRIEKVLSPGARSFVVLPKLAPGQYRFVDEFNADKGELSVIAK